MEGPGPGDAPICTPVVAPPTVPSSTSNARRAPRRLTGRLLAAGVVLCLLLLAVLASAASARAPFTGSDATHPELGARAAVATFNITIHEKGLPAGTVWYVDFNGFQNFTTAPQAITYALPPGTYRFAVPGVPGFEASPTSVSLNLVNGSKSATFQFTPTSPPTYLVTFVESGLAAGTAWWVSLNGSVVFSTASSIEFLVPNGSYVYGVGLVDEYSVSPETGTVVVNASASLVTVKFTSEKGLLGLPGAAGYLLVGLLAIVLLGAALAGFLWWRGRQPPRAAPVEVKLPPQSAT